MHFYNLIKDLIKDKKTVIFVDMDGVIASYDFGKPLDFKNKRPMLTNIKTLESISLLSNVELQILSVCRFDKEIKEKNNWLDKYASFFYKRNILSKESNPNISSADLKLNFLKNFKTKKQIIVIDDDNLVLYTIHNELKEIILYQDSELID